MTAGPLEGVLVLELAQVLAGPLCGMMLADMGAEVIKIERPEGGDLYRSTGSLAIAGESTNFLSTNRSKKSVVLDLASPAGLEAFRTLARSADVLIENFVPGTTARLGIDYEALKGFNPSLVYCSITGFGPSGPSAHLPAVDPIIQAASGIMSLTGSRSGEPVRTGTAAGDIYGAAFAAQGILLALLDRARTGRGQRVEVSLLDAAVFGLIPREGEFFATGDIAPPMGTAHPQFVPFQAFETADAPIFVAAFHDAQWLRLCACLEAADLAEDPGLRSGAGRNRQRERVVARLAGLFLARTAAEWEARLQPARIPVSRINNLRQVFSDPQVRHNQLVLEMTHPTAGPIRGVANPIRLSTHPRVRPEPPPLLGQHTDQVLRRFGIAVPSPASPDA